MGDYDNDMIQVQYNMNQRYKHQIEKKCPKINTPESNNVYNAQKKRRIKIDENEDIWNVKIWDICFASSYGFPDNEMGYLGQWYLEKLNPYSKYLKNIGNYLENIHICYKRIDETDATTLDEMYEKVCEKLHMYESKRTNTILPDVYPCYYSFENLMRNYHNDFEFKTFDNDTNNLSQ
jgi:hypothetical protein